MSTEGKYLHKKQSHHMIQYCHIQIHLHFHRLGLRKHCSQHCCCLQTENVLSKIWKVLKLVRLQTWRIGCWWCTTTTLLSAVASYWAISSSVSRVGCWTLALISPSTRGWSRTSICRCSLVVTAITTIATSTTTTSSRISIFYVEIVI